MLKVKKSNPLYEQIYENLKESIIKGEFKPNERLIDSSIAETLKVSRSPVREAFRKLEHEGLIVNHDGTTLVYQPNLQEIIELFQIRAGLESVAAYWATKWITDDELKDLSESLILVEKALNEKDFYKVVKLNTYFHEHIIQFSGNGRLKHIMANINTLTLLYRNAYFNLFYGSDIFLKEHHDILNAMISGDADLSAEIMKTHITNDMNYLISKFS